MSTGKSKKANSGGCRAKNCFSFAAFSPPQILTHLMTLDLLSTNCHGFSLSTIPFN